MATVYSLLCWGGSSGNAVTLSIASPCVVTFTNHGLDNGTGVVFIDNGDTLPTGLAKNTPYYTYSTGANTFNLYDTQANALMGGATGRINTSGSQAGTHILKSEYYYNLSDTTRWTGGVYGSLAAFTSGRASALSTDEEVCEIGMSWADKGTGWGLSIPAASIRVHTKIDGVRTAGFHAGVIGAGYRLEQTNGGSSTNLKPGKNKTHVEGFTVVLPNGYYGGQPAVDLSAASLCSAKNMIVKPVSTSNNTGGFALSGLGEIYNCLSVGQGYGFQFGAYASGWVANNIATKCITGFQAVSYAPTHIFAYNNIAVGNTTNWAAGVTGLQDSTNNYGLSGEAWIGTGGARKTIATTDFANWGTSSLAGTDDFSPAAVTSAQVETGLEYFGIPVTDISDATAPAYSGGPYGTDVAAGSFVAGLSYTIATAGTTDFTLIGSADNNVGTTFKATGVGSGTGTATLNAKYDGGCYEFDLGYGPHPTSTTVTFSGVPAGSEIRVYDSGGAELAGVESSASNPVLTWTVASGAQRVVIVNLAYRIKEFAYTNQAGAQTVPVQMDADQWYENP